MNFPDRIGYLPSIAIHTNTIITTFGPLKYTRSLGYGGGISLYTVVVHHLGKYTFLYTEITVLLDCGK